MISIMSTEVTSLVTEKKARKARGPDEDRQEDKRWWANNTNWSDAKFKKCLRIVLGQDMGGNLRVGN